MSSQASMISRVRGLFGRLFSSRSHPSNPDVSTLWAWGVRETASGRMVTEGEALTYTAVWACVKLIGESIAALPAFVFERQDQGGKVRAPGHPAYRVVHDEPNPEMTAYDLTLTQMVHLLLWGNSYSEKQYDKAGRLVALWPLRPDTVTISRKGELLLYRITLSDGQEVILTSDQVLHIRGMSHDGLYGMSPIRMMREAIGLGLAAEEYGARLFRNNATPGGVLEHPGKLSDKARKNLRDSWEMVHGGLTNAHRLAILEEGLKFNKIGIPPEDAQFLQTRQFQVREIARMFGVPAHKVADNEGATFASVEQDNLSFISHTLLPWLVCREQAYNRGLFTPSEKPRFFVEHLVQGLQRGDLASRYNAYAIGRQWGWLSVDDVRELEGLNPLPNGAGQQYLVPMNMVPAGSAPTSTDSMDEGRALPQGASDDPRRLLQEAIITQATDAAAEED